MSMSRESVHRRTLQTYPPAANPATYSATATRCSINPKFRDLRVGVPMLTCQDAPKRAKL